MRRSRAAFHSGPNRTGCILGAARLGSAADARVICSICQRLSSTRQLYRWHLSHQALPWKACVQTVFPTQWLLDSGCKHIRQDLMHAHIKKCWMEGNTCCQSGLLYHVLDRRSHPQHDRRYCRQKAHDNTVRFLMVSCTEAQANSSSCGLCKIFPPKVFLAWRGSEWTCLHPNPFEPSWETCRRMPGYRLLDFVFRAVYL